MAADPTTLSIDKLAKYGYFEELRRREAKIAQHCLADLFERAVTDFRSVKRNAGHLKILEWCIDRGLELTTRAGWFSQPVACLAAMNGNVEIAAVMVRKGLPENPFVRAAFGDLEFLRTRAASGSLAELKDVNGFNLLFYCAGSGLGRRDAAMKQRLTEVCRFLLDEGVEPRHEVMLEVPITPALLCAWYGGNEEIMRLLLDRGGLTVERLHLVWEWSLEPHCRSGEPFYGIADEILRQGFDVNDMTGQDRTLLHGAAHRGTLNVVRWLLENGADPNARDHLGRTPLHVCAERNTYVSVAKLLLAAGSQPQALDTLGKTALDYAWENGREKVAACLAAAG